MEKMKFDSKLYILELVLLFGICLMTFLEKSETASLLFSMTFIVLLLGLIMQLLRNPHLSAVHFLAVITIAATFINVVIEAQSVDFEYCRKMIIFFCSVLMIPFVSMVDVKKKHVSWILGMNVAIGALYPVTYYIFGIKGYFWDVLSFNFSNPNITAMFLMHSLMYCFIAFFFFKSKFFKLVDAVIVATLVYFTFLTGARSAILVFVLFSAIVLFINGGKKRKVDISPKLSLFILVLPLIVAFLYMQVVDSPWFNDLFSFMASEGKKLDSREYVWDVALKRIANHPFIGNYDIMREDHMHNIHLDIITTYGIVPFVLFIALLHSGVKNIIKTANTKFSKSAVFAFYGVILQGTFEAALVSGGLGLYIMSFGFLLLAKYNGEVKMFSELANRRNRRLREPDFSAVRNT